MTEETHRPDAASVLIALGFALLGRLAHDVAEFGALSGEFWVTGALIPVGLTTAWWWGFSGSMRDGLAWVLVAWLVLNAVVGGLLSVLPLPIWPFDPAQTLGHYAVHAIYAVSQLPLAWLAWPRS